MVTTPGAMTVTIEAAWTCPADHHGRTNLTARVSLTPAGLTVHHPVGALPTSCRACGVALTSGPVLSVPDAVRKRLTEWAERRGFTAAADWTVAL